MVNPPVYGKNLPGEPNGQRPWYTCSSIGDVSPTNFGHLTLTHLMTRSDIFSVRLALQGLMVTLLYSVGYDEETRS